MIRFALLPILPGSFSDEILAVSAEEKLAHFGPSLHVRRFGTDVLQATLGMVFNLSERYDLTAHFRQSELVEANIPPHHWHTYTGTSVFRVMRRDLRF